MLKALFNLFFGSKKPKQEFYISTQTQSNLRIQNLGLTTPSEDASHILSTSRLNYAPLPLTSAPVEYKPEPDLHWITEITPAAGTVFHKEDLWNIFDKDWRMKPNTSAGSTGHNASKVALAKARDSSPPDPHSSMARDAD